MSLWIICGVLLSAASAVLSESPPCPDSRDIYPCFCHNDYILTSVGCEGFNGLDRLYPVLDKTKGQNMSFGFWKSRLGDIPSDFFLGHQSVNLHFENCRISSFGSKPFTGLENSLKRLYVYGSVHKKEKDLETFPLGHLKNLEYMSFLANNIKRLGNDWFSGGPAALKQINLQANDIEELGDKAFAELENVEQIWLGDNSFQKVSRSMFPRPAKKLFLLEMSFGKLSDLPEDIFDDMPVLRDVNVSGNQLKSIPEATWGRVWEQLDAVYLERNQGFVCDEKIKWIYQRKLPRQITGTCSEGIAKLRGKKLKELVLEDFE